MDSTTTTRQEPTMIDPAVLIAFHTRGAAEALVRQIRTRRVDATIDRIVTERLAS